MDVRQHKHVTVFVCQRECVCVLTFAGLGVGFEDKSLRARAGVGARSVSAQTVVTKQTAHQTLIDVCMEAREGIG